MYTLRVRSHFDAAHFLPWHEGKCKNLHGHRWEVEVVIESETLDENGIVMDFSVIKDLLKLVLPDHCLLNDWLENPTAENIAEELFNFITNSLRKRGFPGLSEITVWESPNCSVTYRPDFDLSDITPHSFFTKPHVTESFPPFTLDNVTERHSNENP